MAWGFEGSVYERDLGRTGVRIWLLGTPFGVSAAFDAVIAAGG